MSERISTIKYDSIIELFEYYECEYISTVLANEDGYKEMYNVKLRLPPSEGNIVNEDFYMSLLNDVALYSNYSNFIINDESQNLKVKVKCENGQILKVIINGIEDYFKYKKQELAEHKYVEIKKSEFIVNSEYITNAISNGWNSSQEFGTKESTFNGYDIYFDEGIEVRKIQGKIYNIVFTKNYKNEIVNGLTTLDSHQNVRLKLGEPVFEDVINNIIGYKGNDFYIFFGNNEVSIYRNESVDVSGLMALIDKYKVDELNLLEFMNELTYLWPDYNEYEYDSSTVYISYALKGFEIKINYNNERGFIFYNNFNMSQSKLENYLISDDYKAYLQTDVVFKAEVARLEENKEMIDNAYVFADNFLENNVYDIYLEKTKEEEIVKVYFISKDGTKPNKELNDSINTFGWISDNYFIFSKTAKGLYCLNIDNGEVLSLILDTKKFNITETGNAYIIYDGIEQRFEF